MLRRLNIMAVDRLVRWEHLLQDTLIDLLLEAFGSIF